MIFTVKKADFLKELQFMQGVVEKRNTIPILSYLLLKSYDPGSILIMGTDLDVSIKCKCEAQVNKAGAVAVQAKKLFEVVRSLPEAEISLRREETDWVSLTCERSSFKIVGQSVENYPAIPELDGDTVSIPSEVFRTLIAQTIFAITQEESRYALGGALLVLTANQIRMVSTDGHRLAFAETGVTAVRSGEIRALIPKKTLSELQKLVSVTEEPVQFRKDENHLFFRVGERLLVSRMLSGQFPNYELVMPKENNRIITFDGELLHQAIRRVSLMADERSRAIKFNITEGRIDISSQNSEVGEALESVPVDYAGQSIVIGFNAQYLIDFFNVVGGGEVRLELKDEQSQAQIRPVGNGEYDYRYVIMPMRL